MMRFRLRRFIMWGAACVALVQASVAPPVAFGEGPRAPAFGPGTVLPPDVPPFAVPRRVRLTQTALLFPDSDDDGALDEGVYVLPVPVPWPATAAGPRSWELKVASGSPVYVLAALSRKEPFKPGAVVLVDGAAVPLPERYAVRLPLPTPKGPQDYQAMALVLPPPEPGRHTVTVACNGCAPRDDPWLSKINTGPRTYILEVVAPPEARPAAAAERPPAGVILDRTFNSEALGREMPYRIYLPPDYAATGPDGAAPLKRYPVVYLLHGLGGTLWQWSNLGVGEALDRLFAGQGSGDGPSFIAVMPAGRSGYWVNHADGGPLWADYVARDLVRHVDGTYRTLPARNARLIAGISMGGHGALQLSLNYPDIFGAAAAHSPSLRPREDAPAFLGGLLSGLSGSGDQAYAARDPISLLKRVVTPRLNAVWVDIGIQDRFAPRAWELHNTMTRLRVAHEWRLAPGNHDPLYWRAHLDEYVRFYRRTLATDLSG